MTNAQVLEMLNNANEENKILKENLNLANCGIRKLINMMATKKIDDIRGECLDDEVGKCLYDCRLCHEEYFNKWEELMTKKYTVV